MTCDLSGQWTGLTPDCVYKGYILRRPQCGRRLVVFCDPSGHSVHRHESICTSPIKRIVGGLFENEMFFETDHGVYHLALGRTVLSAPRGPRLRAATSPLPEPREEVGCRQPAPLPLDDPNPPAVPLAA